MTGELFINGYAVLNAAVSLAIAWVCLCRLASMDRHTTLRIARFGYALMFTASLANGGSRWLFNEQPGPGSILLGLALLGHLLMSVKVWRDGMERRGERTEPMPVFENTLPEYPSWKA